MVLLTVWQNLLQIAAAQAQTPKASFKSAQGNALGNALGWSAKRLQQALKARSIEERRQALGLRLIQIARGPKALPWPGMKQAFGLRESWE